MAKPGFSPIFQNVVTFLYHNRSSHNKAEIDGNVKRFPSSTHMIGSRVISGSKGSPNHDERVHGDVLAEAGARILNRRETKERKLLG